MSHKRDVHVFSCISNGMTRLKFLRSQSEFFQLLQ